MEYILTTDNLTKIYGDKRAADSISLHIKKGDVYGLLDLKTLKRSLYRAFLSV